MIDVNGTRHHLLLGGEDWRPRIAAGGTGVAWDAGGATVGLRPRERRLPRPPGAELLDAADRRGAGADRWGNVYWIGDGEGSVRHLPAGTRDAGELWRAEELLVATDPAPGGDFTPCPEVLPPSPPVLRGLAVTRCHYLVVGTVGPAGLLVFDLHAGGPPLWLRWPAAVPFAPFDLAPAPDGGVFVLDRESSRLWRLDRWFGVLPAGGTVEIEPPEEPDFRPVGEVAETRPGRGFPAGLDLDLAAPLGVASAVAVAALPDGSVLVLESDPAFPFSRLHRFHAGDKLGELSLEGILEPVLEDGADPGDFHVAGHDLVFLATGGAEAGERVLRGELYVASRGGRQAFLFDLEAADGGLTLRPRPRLYPLRAFGGKALVASPGAGSEVSGEVSEVEVLYDFGERWLPVVPWPGRRYGAEGAIEGLVFDGGTPGTTWHRLILDACIPSGTGVAVESRSADERHLLGDLPFRREPSPVLRPSGSELPFVRPFGDRPAAAGSWELLLQDAEGRFVELRLTLTGDGRSTPRIRALRLYYPRFSYLGEYLPAVYGEDATSASFLDRFLANFEGLFTALEGRVAGAEVLFDPRTAPAESLPWLAGWLGALLEPEWGEARRRLFVAHVAELYRWRGTRAGLLAAVRMAVDPCPGEEIFAALPASAGTDAGVRLVERFQTRSLPPTALGDPTVLEGPGFVAAGEPWRPEHGAAALHRRYRAFLARCGAEVAAGTRFPPLPPAAGAELGRWRAFVRTLGFPYAEVTPSDADRWRAFLARRHRRIDDLNLAHRRSEASGWGSFAEIPLPPVLPEVPAELADWIGFASLALPLDRDAHRFTVLVPARPGESEAARELRRARARAAVERQKPAHADFDVQLFWALFQVGGARLGLDTVLGEGSRFTALALGSGHLGASFLADQPWRDPDCCVPPRPTIESDPSACEPSL